MTLLEHLDELRFRLVRCSIAIGIGFLACYGFAEQLFNYLVAPLLAVMPESSTLIFTELPEAFFTYLKISAVAGMFLSSPYIFYQIWAFIAPGLYDEEKKYIAPMAAISAIFFTAGACFGYFIVFPFAFDFFMSFNSETIQAMPKLGEYLSFSLKLLIAFGLIFEMPLFAFFGARIGILTAEKMRKGRKIATLCFFIVAAILTPPDVVSQLLMAGPLLLLYEVSIYVAQIFGRKSRTEEETEEPEESEA
ncbi:twin-arginine translocase subunit TatC [Oleidesulfovibrio sp.]|uniref:twin-arginine translocase subunit TatC n=1 Tax=Oleidesulfovibrio sp. TaxID=2909707 RepID=UPI003A861971